MTEEEEEDNHEQVPTPDIASSSEPNASCALRIE
jgi:hypothetical protein